LAQAQASIIEAQAKFLTAAGDTVEKEAQACLIQQQAALTDAVRQELEVQIQAKRLALVEYRRALDALHREQAKMQEEIRLMGVRGSELLYFNQYEGLTADLVRNAWIGCHYFLSKATEITRWATGQEITADMRAPGNWCHVRDQSDRPPPAEIRNLVRLVQWGQASSVMPVAGSPAAALMDGLVDRLTNAADADAAACRAYEEAIEKGVAAQWPAMQILSLPLPPEVKDVISKQAGK
jgi:hypothetical protein